MSVSVVIPVYNEQEVIEEVVNSIYKNIISKVPDSEFLIVNDSSTDDTPNILKRLSKKYKKIRVINNLKNMGYSRTVRRGYREAKKDWVFNMGSDNEHDTAEFWKLDKLKNDYDIVLGQRKNRKDPLHRLITTRLARLVNFLLFGSLIVDSNSGFKLTNRRALHQIMELLPDDAFSYDMLVTMMARYLGYKMKEVPVTHYGRQSGKCHYLGWKLVKGVLQGGMDMVDLRIRAFNLPKSEFNKAKEIQESRKRS